MQSNPKDITGKLPPKGHTLGITIKYCDYYNMPYIYKVDTNYLFGQQLPKELQSNTWILAIDNSLPITKEGAIDIFKKTTKI
jgi:hypothetical protein